MADAPGPVLRWNVGTGRHHGSVTKTVKLDGDALLARLAAQHGVISRAQTVACGMTAGTLRHRIRAGGPWQPLLPGVYLTR